MWTQTLSGVCYVRDLWRLTDLPDAKGALKLAIPPHGVVLLKLAGLSATNRKPAELAQL
jgi:hypothetical protein